jgi:hypothetical protein
MKTVHRLYDWRNSSSHQDCTPSRRLEGTLRPQQSNQISSATHVRHQMVSYIGCWHLCTAQHTQKRECWTTNDKLNSSGEAFPGRVPGYLPFFTTNVDTRTCFYRKCWHPHLHPVPALENRYPQRMSTSQLGGPQGQLGAQFSIVLYLKSGADFHECNGSQRPLDCSLE